MTDEIKEALDKALTLSEVEDIYRPYKEKKKTKATEAIDNAAKDIKGKLGL